MSTGVDKPTFQPVLFGKYLLLGKIGSGGMAEIYRAKTFGPYGFEKEYAIKKILPHLNTDGDFVSMFINEAKLTVSLHHTNIVQVLELGEIGQQCFISMEYVFGKDLHDLLSRCAQRKLRIPLKLALFITMEILKGLDYAHEAVDRKGQALDLVHCDVSPSNVLLGYEGGVQVGDFGVARAATQTNAKMDNIKGKIGYMSPEQVSGAVIDRRSDLFSCGIVLYEMLALRRLFMGDNDLNVMLKIRDGDVGRQLGALRSFPKELQDIVVKALAQDPDERYQSASEFHRDVLDFTFSNNIKVTSVNLRNFLKTVFKEEYEEGLTRRQEDPDSTAVFPDLLSPEVARWRYREPNGNIIGPMSRDTLMSLLTRGRDIGCAVSLAYGPWDHPDAFPELSDELEGLARSLEPKGEGFAYSATVAQVASDTIAALERLSSENPQTSSSSRVVANAAPDMEGSLAEMPFGRLLDLLAARRVTGVLQVKNDTVEKQIYLEEGSPGYVASNKPDELLGNFLIAQDVITHQQLNDALAQLGEFGGRLGDILIKGGFLPSEELFHYLSLQVREKLLDVFSWSEGTFCYTAGQRLPGESYPLGINTLEIIMEGIRTRMRVEFIASFFAARTHQPLQLLTSKHINLDGSMLTKSELAIALTIRDGSTIASTTRLLDRDPNMILRVVFMLYAVGLIDFEQMELA